MASEKQIEEISPEEAADEAAEKLIKALKYQIKFNGLQVKTAIKDEFYKRALTKAKGSLIGAVSILKKEGAFKEPKQKQYYTVELTGMAPVTLNYRVFSETPEEAVQLVERNITGMPFSIAPKIQFVKFRKLQARVFKIGTNMVEYLRKF